MKRHIACFAVLCLLLGSLLGGCGDGSGGSFRFPLDAEPRQLDPQVATDSASVTLIAALFEGLTRLDEAGRAVAGAADWTVSPDGLTYTFTLRESYWSTLSIRGKETPWDVPVAVSAYDFVFGMQRAVDPATGSAAATQFYGIRHAKEVHEGHLPLSELGVEAVSHEVLTITLAAPDPHFPALLATAPFMPCNKEFFLYTAGQYGLEKDYLLTNGPFRLAAWNHEESLLLYKHEDYHAAAAVSPQAVRYLISPEEAATALQEGRLDAAALTLRELDAVKQAGVQTVKLEDRIRSVYFNTAAAPLSDTSLRQALRSSLEWQTIYAYLQEAGEPTATGYVAPAAVLPDGKIYRQSADAITFATDVEQARAALGQALAALYPEDTSPTLPQLTVLAAEDEVTTNLARYLIQSWQKHLNIYAKLETVTETELAARMRSNRYQIAIYTTAAHGLTGAENLQSYTTHNRGNLTKFSSPAVDAAAARAMTGGQAELAALEALLAEQCPTLPLSFPARYYGIASVCKGITVRPFGGGAYGAALDFQQAKKKG